MRSPHYSLIDALKGRALQSTAMGLCLGVAGKLSFWSARPRENASTEANATDGRETLRVRALLLQARPLIDSHVSICRLNVNDVG